MSYGTAAGSHPNLVQAGAATAATVTGLVEGTTYYFVVNATNQAGQQSVPSSEVSYQPPVTTVGAGSIIPHTGWTLRYVDSAETNGYPATNAFDGDPNTFWHSNFTSPTQTLLPHEIQIDMGVAHPLQGFHYLPRQDNYMTGTVEQYEFYTSMDGVTWGAPAVTGIFAATHTEKEALFNSVNARYFRFRVLTAVDGDCSVAELNVLLGTAVAPPANHAPVAAAQSLTTAEDTPLAMVLTATDADGNPLTYTLVSSPAHGTLTGTAPNVTYSPAANYNGGDSFTFKANDGTLDSSVATVSITVTPVNDAPAFTVNPLNLKTTVGTAVTGQLTAVDVDAGAQLTYSKVSGPAWLSVAANGAFSGTPLSANAGTNAFVVGVSDGIAPVVTAALNITVTNVNHAPVFTLNPIPATDAREGVAYTGQTLAGQAADSDAGDVISYSKVSGPAWLNVAADGTLSGTPPTGSAGLNSFVVRATDLAGATGDAQLQINVVGTLPLPWVTAEIGSGQLAGSAAYAAGTFTQAGAGLFGGTSDSYRFTYQTLSGDGEIIAKVSALQNTGTASRVGVMIRDSLAANAKQAFMGLTGSNAYRRVVRTATGGSNSTSSSSTGTVPNTWVRLVRTGNVITAYKSANGTTWTSVSKTTITMATNCYIGLAVASGRNTVLNTSQFSNVSVTP